MLGLLVSASSLGFAPAPTFELNLSAPPRERWNGALELVLSRHRYEDSWLPTFAEHNRTLFDRLQPEHWSALTAALERHFPETAEELRGIHDQFSTLLPHAGVTFEYLVGWIYFHELAHTPLMRLMLGLRIPMKPFDVVEPLRDGGRDGWRRTLWEKTGKGGIQPIRR